MSRFLPKALQDYAIPQARDKDFTPGQAELLEDIGRKMNVKRAATEGRIPSPFSRAFVFYLNLFGQGFSFDLAPDFEGQALDRGRSELQKEARSQLRGLLGAFIFRDALRLQVSHESYMLNPQAGVVDRVLYESIGASPRGGLFWNPIRYYSFRSLDSEKSEVVAGCSPLTALYPAAVPMKGFRSAYWYDYNNGTWYDPTGREFDEEGVIKVAEVTRSEVCKGIKSWINHALRDLQQNAAVYEHTFGLSNRDRNLLIAELQAWQSEMVTTAVDAGTVETRPIDNLSGEALLPFLQQVAVVNESSIITDLAISNGTLVCTRDDLLNPNKRIYGRQHGSPDYDNVLNRLSERGSNLGFDLGLGENAIPLPYVFIDLLFTTNLTFVANQSSGGLSSEWSALNVGSEEIFLFPFKPGIFELLSPRELKNSVEATLDQRGENYIVKLKIGGAVLTKLYSANGQGDFVADNVSLAEPDIRFFPNYRLEDVADRFPTGQALYYSRIRLSPQWEFPISAFAIRDGRVFFDSDFIDGANWAKKATLGFENEAVEHGTYRAGQRQVMTFSKAPNGYFAEDRGLFLLDLPSPTNSRSEWSIGVDFGTSNTCVTFKAGDEKPEVLRLPVLTTTFLNAPIVPTTYSHPSGVDVNEGASALLDFFFRQYPTDRSLSSKDYFPTQVITLHREVQEDPEWDYGSGLIFFRNISLADPIMWRLIRSFLGDNSAMAQQPSPRFFLRQDIKWSHRGWLKALMQHLRYQIMLAAAYRGARVAEVSFSFPKSFSWSEKDNFENILRQVWMTNITEQRIALKTVSESEAVRNYIVSEANEYVVFDVGGGTTDLISFSERRPIFQTSFKLAAGQLNKYVVESAAWRKLFLAATKDSFSKEEFSLNPSLEERFLVASGQPGYEPQVIETVWLGLLEMIESAGPQKLASVLSTLRQAMGDSSKEESGAVLGFFMSLSMLFSGLAYHAGYLLGAGQDGLYGGRSYKPNHIDLILTGNGSKLYRLIDNEEFPYRDVMKHLFSRGLMQSSAGGAVVRTLNFSGLFKLPNGEPAPKTSVALGLLTSPPRGLDDNVSVVPVANIIGEFSYAVNGNEAEREASLVDFYQQVASGKVEIPSQPPVMIKDFVTTMAEALPLGKNGGLPVIPGAGRNWHEKVLDTLYPRATNEIHTRIIDNAGRLKDELKNAQIEEVSALDSVFVIELAALMDRIRDEYA